VCVGLPQRQRQREIRFVLGYQLGGRMLVDDTNVRTRIWIMERVSVRE